MYNRCSLARSRPSCIATWELHSRWSGYSALRSSNWWMPSLGASQPRRQVCSTRWVRLTLTHATLSAISVHVSITCYLLAWAIKQIDNSCHAFLWCGMASVAGGKCKVAWAIVCSPKCYGGLGMSNIRILRFALWLRWEWQRRAADAPA